MLQHTLSLFHFLVLTVKHSMFIIFLGILIIFALLAEVHVYIFIKLFWVKRESDK